MEKYVPVLACWLMPAHRDKPIEKAKKSLVFAITFLKKKKRISAKREVTWHLSTFDRHIKLQTGLKSSNGFVCHILHQANSEAVGLISAI